MGGKVRFGNFFPGRKSTVKRPQDVLPQEKENKLTVSGVLQRDTKEIVIDFIIPGVSVELVRKSGGTLALHLPERTAESIGGGILKTIAALREAREKLLSEEASKLTDDEQQQEDKKDGGE